MDPVIAIACIILAVAAYIDWKEHRVPNELTFSVFTAGLMYHLLPNMGQGIGFAALGALVGFLTLIIPYALCGMGAGDVKLMAAVGAWVGPMVILHSFLWMALVGGVMGVIGMIRSGRFQERLLLTVLAGKNLARLRPLDSGQFAEAPKKVLLPYGVPIALGFYAYALFGGMV